MKPGNLFELGLDKHCQKLNKLEKKTFWDLKKKEKEMRYSN